jgi:hypothetical protein
LSLLKARNARKEIEKDATALANRISMLSQEENKLLRKIDETRKRADQILALKEINEEKYQSRVDVKKKEGEDVDKERERNQIEKVKQKRMMESKSEYTLSIKRTEVESARNFKLELEEEVKEFRDLGKLENLERKKIVREEEKRIYEYQQFLK